MPEPTRRILLIEPDAKLAGMIEQALQAHRLEVIRGPDGRDPVTLVREIRPDLVLLAVDLPQRSGFLICKELKEEEPLKRIPLILVAGQDKAKDLDQHRKLKVRAEDYLTRPFTDEEMLYKIDNLLGFHIDADQLGALQQQLYDFVQEKASLESKIHDLQEELSRVRAELRAAVGEKEVLEEHLRSSREREGKLQNLLEKALQELRSGRS